MNEQITTLTELEALPVDSAILDSSGDVGIVGSKDVTYRETAPMALFYVAKHYLPARVLYRPDRPVPTTAEAAEGIVRAIEGQAQWRRERGAEQYLVPGLDHAARIAREYGQGGVS